MTNQSYFLVKEEILKFGDSTEVNRCDTPSGLVLILEYFRRSAAWRSKTGIDFESIAPKIADIVFVSKKQDSNLDSPLISFINKKGYSSYYLKNYLEWLSHHDEVKNKYGYDLNPYESWFWLIKRHGGAGIRFEMGFQNYCMRGYSITLKLSKVISEYSEMPLVSEFSDEILDEIDREFDKDPMAFKEKYLQICSLFRQL